MLAYSGVFAAAVALAWLAPARLAGAAGGIVLAAVVVCAYALLTKVLPNELTVTPKRASTHACRNRTATGTQSA